MGVRTAVTFFPHLFLTLGYVSGWVILQGLHSCLSQHSMACMQR